MAGEIDFTAVNGYSKKVYDGAVKNTLPTSSVAQRRFELSKDKRIGDTYQQAVVLVPPNGFTYEGSAGGVNQLKNPRNMETKQAALTPFAMTLREQVGITALSRLQEQGEGAIKSLIGEMMLALKSSIANRLEAQLVLGQQSYGTVESVTGTDGVSMAVVFTEATWRPGLWHAFNKGSTWHTFQAGGTARNASNPIILTGITSSTRTVTFSITGTVATNAAAGDTFHPEGARTSSTAYNEMPGLITQARNTSGTSLGIDASLYPVWAGNTASVGGNLTFEGVEEYVGQLRDRGADGKIEIWLSNRGWGQLSKEVMALRMMDAGYSGQQAKVGTRSISIVSTDVGEMEFVNHPFMAQGEALFLPTEEVKRVGSSDITFGIPGAEEGTFWQRVPGYSAAEIQCMTDQAILLKAPSRAYFLNGIVYT